MTAYALTLSALIIPFLLSGVPTHRKGLVQGLFLSLFFWSSIVLPLGLIALSCAVYVFLRTGLPAQLSRAKPAPSLWLANPVLPIFLVFLLTMGIFCVLAGAITDYGRILQLPSPIRAYGRGLSFAASLAGPIVFGNLCDRKGPFFSAVLLTLTAEISVLLASAASIAHTFFLLSVLSANLCAFGFFIVMPEICKAFWGADRFLRVYPFIVLIMPLLWQGLRPAASKASAFYLSGDFLSSLLILSLVAALFLYMSWKKRLTLLGRRR